MIDARTQPPATGSPVHDEALLLQAGQWVVWQTLARGLAHQLANASQLLTLDPPQGLVLDEARARVARAHTVLAGIARPRDARPSFLPQVLADFDALQQLQIGLPEAALTADVDDPLPLTALPEADLLHVLLLIATRLKQACPGRRLGLRVRARAAEDSVVLAIEPVETGAPEDGTPHAAPAPLLEAAAVLVARSGGSLCEAGAGWALTLPEWHARD